MYAISFFAVKVFLIFSSAVTRASIPYNHCPCGVKPSIQRVQGGIHSQVGSHPWFGAIFNRRGQVICGATIINSEYLLTAAHCFKSVDPRRYRIIVNVYDISRRGKPIKPNQLQTIKELKIHPEYGTAKHNDLALIRVKTPMKLDWSTSFPVCLPLPAMPLTGESVTVLGYGSDGTVRNTERLFEAELKITDERPCKTYYKQHVKLPHQLCATNPGKNACSGDSGGPLLLKQSTGVILVGIVNGGIECDGSSSSLGIYINVSHYLSWIGDNSRTENGC